MLDMRTSGALPAAPVVDNENGVCWQLHGVGPICVATRLVEPCTREIGGLRPRGATDTPWAAWSARWGPRWG